MRITKYIINIHSDLPACCDESELQTGHRPVWPLPAGCGPLHNCEFIPCHFHFLTFSSCFIIVLIGGKLHKAAQFLQKCGNSVEAFNELFREKSKCKSLRLYIPIMLLYFY